uniref:Uncharacterized protein n=1 Tax=viral metagenome TaxID=1070528 RepID=A0A6M3IYQ7_9ZZZZ
MSVIPFAATVGAWLTGPVAAGSAAAAASATLGGTVIAATAATIGSSLYQSEQAKKAVSGMTPITPITPPAAPKAPEVPTPVVPSLLTTPSTTTADNELATQTQELKDAETAKLAKKKRSTILTSPRGVLEPAKIGFKTLLGE